jgi:hypothetical protein
LPKDYPQECIKNAPSCCAYYDILMKVTGGVRAINLSVYANSGWNCHLVNIGNSFAERTAVLIDEEDIENQSASASNAIAWACTRASPAATIRPPDLAGPPSHEVMVPPAPVMIGISGITS